MVEHFGRPPLDVPPACLRARLRIRCAPRSPGHPARPGGRPCRASRPLELPAPSTNSGHGDASDTSLWAYAGCDSAAQLTTSPVGQRMDSVEPAATCQPRWRAPLRGQRRHRHNGHICSLPAVPRTDRPRARTPITRPYPWAGPAWRRPGCASRTWHIPLIPNTDTLSIRDASPQTRSANVLARMFLLPISFRSPFMCQQHPSVTCSLWSPTDSPTRRVIAASA